jgi:hypothetical protein
VPTDLGLVSHQVQLEVLVPDVFILGPKDLIVDRGTTLSLVCIVENVRTLFFIFLFFFDVVIFKENEKRTGSKDNN